MAFSFFTSPRRRNRSVAKSSVAWAPTTAWAPSVRRLEPRLVLNASAELNPLGQLVLVGTGFDDSLRIEFDQNAALQIFDDSDPGNLGQVVPIDGHPGGVGNESDPLFASDITSGQLRVELGPGNDALSLPLLGTLDVFVLGEDGNDTTVLQLDESMVPATGSLFVQAEQITLASASNDLSLGQVDVQLVGAVRFDSALTSPRLQIDNELSIIGPTTLSVDTTLTGMGLIDLDESVLSADAPGVDLRFEMAGGNIRFGEINGDGGQLLSTLTIQSSSDVLFGGNEVLLENGLSVETGVSDIRIESTVVASSVSVSVANIDILADITSTAGDIQIDSSESLILDRQAELFSGDNRILLSGNGSDLDTGGGTLRSNFGGDAIVLSDFEQAVLGDTFAAGGQLVLGRTGGELGDVMQEASTAIIAERLSGMVMGEVNLSNDTNQIRVITDLVGGGDIDIVDSTDDLLVESLVSSSGNVNVMASGALAVGKIQAIGQNSGQSINLKASRIDDASNDMLADLIAEDVTLTASSGIGAQRGLELMETTELIAITDAGDVNLLVLGDQSIVIREVSTSNADVSLKTTGNASDLMIGQITVAGDGLVTLCSSDDILNLSDASLVSASRLSLIAANGVGDQEASIDVRTDVDDLAAKVDGGLRGDLVVDNIDALTPLRLGALANQTGQPIEPIQTGNGQIIIRNAGEIQVVDQTPGDAGSNQRADPEIIARGSHGRVDLQSPLIDLQDDVQIHGEKLFQDLGQAALPRPLGELTDPGGNRDDRAIFLTANQFHVGADVELFTGEDQGTARRFLPRAASGQSVSGIEDAFFDPVSVQTNVLTQALQNDATGILTVNVGTPGERGLTVTIDWGDSDPRRFQQIDNLHADENAVVGVNPADIGQPTATSYSPGDGTVSFTHLYQEQDTLDSRSNGRTAATDPYNVRFAVRHHDSIVVQSLVEGESASVFQSGTTVDPIPVAGGLISSTDNPTTNFDSGAGPLLESGSASFIIPNLTIPVAFFPVRDVIPEFETVATVVSTEQSVEVLTTTLEVAEVPTTSIVSREEYFQLRVLSPDPNGEDLAPPEKLPREIFDGDRLRQLFSRLPDGAYEIEKVVGDGNERSILRVEVRDGEATIPDEELDEGVLRLTPLDSQEELPKEISVESDGWQRDSADAESGGMHGPLDVTLETDPNLASLPGVAMMAVTGAVFTTRKRRLRRLKNNIVVCDSPTRSRLSRGSRFGKRHHG